jgi:hypothetical protein
MLLDAGRQWLTRPGGTSITGVQRFWRASTSRGSVAGATGPGTAAAAAVLIVMRIVRSLIVCGFDIVVVF